MVEQSLRGNIARVHERIDVAKRRAGRTDTVTLVAVSKTQGAETVASAYRDGLHIFGENRVEEAGPKVAAVAELVAPLPSPQWHMIGHLQSRKATAVLPWAALVHSVDSPKLASRLSRAVAPGQQLAVLLEVNVSGEASKDGLAPAALAGAVEAIVELPGLRIEGLMTMAPLAEDPEETRPVFRQLRLLRDEMARRYPAASWRHLSMGMSDDFEIAIEEGATLVRIGRAIFGAR